MRISGEKGQGVRNRLVSSRASAWGLTRPGADCLLRPLRSHFQQWLTPSVISAGVKEDTSMHTQHLVIDETWYRRLPAAKERITAGGVVLRREDQCVYLALAREGDIPPFVLPKGGVEPDEPIEAAARR